MYRESKNERKREKKRGFFTLKIKGIKNFQSSILCVILSIEDYKTFEMKNIKDVFIIKYIILFICIERARMKEREKKKEVSYLFGLRDYSFF